MFTGNPWRIVRHPILSLLLFFSVGVQAQGIVIIANPSVALTAKDIKDVFLGEKQYVGSVKLIPVDNTSAQNKFLAQLINLSADKYAAIWTKKSFREGLTPPPVKNSDIEVIEFVKRTSGAIGYIESALPASGVVEIKN